MRWERFFEDLEDQLDSEWEAERAALETEAERLRISRLTLRERLVPLALPRDRSISVDLVDGSVVVGSLVAVGADWAAVDVDSRRGGAVLLPLHAITALGMPVADLLGTARNASTGTTWSQRMTFGFVVRDLVRRRIPVTVRASGGRTYAGTIDRAGADHLDIALHDAGAVRRADGVTGHRIVSFAAVLSVRLDAPAALP